MLIIPLLTPSSLLLSSPPHTALPVSSFPFTSSYYCIPSSLPWKPWPLCLLTNFLTSTGILNETHIPEDSKLTSTNVREPVTFVFLDAGSLTQNDAFQLHPFTCKLQIFTFLNSWILHCANLSHFHYSFISWLTSLLFTFPACYKHSRMNMDTQISL